MHIFFVQEPHFYGLVYQTGRTCHAPIFTGNLDNSPFKIRSATEWARICMLPKLPLDYTLRCLVVMYIGGCLRWVHITTAQVPQGESQGNHLRHISNMLSLFSLKSLIITLSSLFFLQMSKSFFDLWSCSWRPTEIACKQCLPTSKVMLRALAGARALASFEWTLWPGTSQGLCSLGFQIRTSQKS